MRVLLFSDYFCEDTTTFIYNEVIGLSKNGHEVMYMCGERINKVKFPFENVVEIPYYLNPILRKLRWYMEKQDHYLSFKNGVYSHRISQVIKEFKPDIIHCHFGYQALKLLDNFKYNQTPVVISFHGYDATYKFNLKAYVNILKRHIENEMVHLFLVCEYFKRNFVKNMISLKNAYIVYCGIDLALFNRTHYPDTNKPFTFLQISSFHEKKGHAYTVYAFSKLLEQHPEFNGQLVFGGNGLLFEDIKQLVFQLGLKDRIIFKGLVSPQETKQLLEEANCFVHHSVIGQNGDSEGCPTAIMEAMAMELPILSTFHSGIPEMVTDGVHGFLVNEKDIDTYALKMWEIMGWGFKKENRQHIEDHFNIKLHIKELEKNFTKILGETQSK